MESIEKIKECLSEALSKEGYDLYEANLARDKDGLKLSIVVDRREPVSLDDIVKVSSLINPILDSLDPFDGPYTLDVSSLGAEKPLKTEKLGDYVGSYVNIHLSKPYKGSNTLEGTIEAVVQGNLTLSYFEKARKVKAEIAIANIDKARLAIKF